MCPLLQIKQHGKNINELQYNIFFNINAGFFYDGSKNEYDAIKSAVNHTSATSNVSLALNIFHVSSEKSLFDQGKLSRLTLLLNMEIALALE